MEAMAPSVALLVQPAPGFLERHDWHIKLMVRNHNGEVSAVSDVSLTEPVIAFGRLMLPVWFRLQRSNAMILGRFSTDGLLWNDAGQAPTQDGAVMGMIASSGIAGVDAAVRFDHLVKH
jgi:hypothetical protein